MKANYITTKKGTGLYVNVFNFDAENEVCFFHYSSIIFTKKSKSEKNIGRWIPKIK